MKKEILIDIYKTNNLNSGLGQFSNNYAQKILEKGSSDYNITLLTPKNLQAKYEYQPILKTANFQKRYLPFLNSNFDLWHCLHQFPSHFPGKNTKMLLTIHDLNFLFEKNEKKSEKYLKRLQKNVNRADAISVISNYTGELLKQHVDLNGKDIHTIHNGVILQEFKDVKQPNYIKNDKFFFSIGIISAKKNFHVLVPVMKNFDDYHLIIAGNKNSDYAKEIEAMAKKLGIEDRIHLVGLISDEEKFWLYKNCEAFLFPSIAEGFGLPAIEAMLMGKPTFLSTHTCLPEIGGEQAYYWTSFEPEQMTSVLRNHLLEYSINKETKSEAIKEYARKFSWEYAISKYIELYKKIID